MKCHVCKGKADVKLPAHNAKFCSEHFDQFFIRQIKKAIKRYDMLSPGAKVMIAVSGGKDSLSAADVLGRLGYEVRGVHIDLGIGGNEFSMQSRETCRLFCEERGIPVELFSVKESYGKSVTEAGEHFPRFCAFCGMTKRYLMNKLAVESGAEALSTGHNLDDLASSLFANILRWDISYIAKTLPVLPAKEGFAKKIKPLTLVTEEEINIYSQFRGIKTVSAECPYSKGAKFKKYKELLNELEENSPGIKRPFYEKFTKVSYIFDDDTFSKETASHPCSVCGYPTLADICTFCRMWRNEGK